MGKTCVYKRKKNQRHKKNHRPTHTWRNEIIVKKWKKAKHSTKGQDKQQECNHIGFICKIWDYLHWTRTGFVALQIQVGQILKAFVLVIGYVPLAYRG